MKLHIRRIGFHISNLLLQVSVYQHTTCHSCVINVGTTCSCCLLLIIAVQRSPANFPRHRSGHFSRLFWSLKLIPGASRDRKEAEESWRICLHLAAPINKDRPLIYSAQPWRARRLTAENGAEPFAAPDCLRELCETRIVSIVELLNSISQWRVRSKQRLAISTRWGSRGDKIEKEKTASCCTTTLHDPSIKIIYR